MTDTTTSRDDRGHGRVERRTIRVAPADDTLFPGAAQAFRLRRDTGGLDGVMDGKEIVYGVTSLPADLARPAHLNYYERRHWVVETVCTGCATSLLTKIAPSGAPAPRLEPSRPYLSTEQGQVFPQFRGRLAVAAGLRAGTAARGAARVAGQGALARPDDHRRSHDRAVNAVGAVPARTWAPRTASSRAPSRSQTFARPRHSRLPVGRRQAGAHGRIRDTREGRPAPADHHAGAQ
jgi:hypothetical protein